MQSAKQKVCDAAAASNEHVGILKAKAEEKPEISTAPRTREGEDMIEERRKVKEAEAKMRLQEAEDEHAAPVLMQNNPCNTIGADVFCDS